MPWAASVARQIGDRLRRARERLRLRDLRADVHVQADELAGSAGAPCRRIIAPRRAIDTPNFVALDAGRDVRMAAGVDVRIDAHGHARRRALSRGDVGDAPDLAGDSALIAATPSAIARSSSAARLADAREDDVGRLEARAQGDLDLAARVGVGAARPAPAGAGRWRASRWP